MITESLLLTRFTFVSCALSTSVTYTPKFSASHQRLRLLRSVDSYRHLHLSFSG